MLRSRMLFETDRSSICLAILGAGLGRHQGRSKPEMNQAEVQAGTANIPLKKTQVT